MHHFISSSVAFFQKIFETLLPLFIFIPFPVVYSSRQYQCLSTTWVHTIPRALKSCSKEWPTIMLFACMCETFSFQVFFGFWNFITRHLFAPGTSVPVLPTFAVLYGNLKAGWTNCPGNPSLRNYFGWVSSLKQEAFSFSCIWKERSSNSKYILFFLFLMCCQLLTNTK